MVVYVAVCEIFSVKEWCDLENGVRARSRSLEMALFDRSHTSSYSLFVSFARYSDLLVENREFFLPHLYLTPRRGWPRRNFVKMFDASKTRMIGLGYRMVKILWLYVKPFSSDTGTLRTDGQTDIFAISISRISILRCWRAIKMTVVQFLWSAVLFWRINLSFRCFWISSLQRKEHLVGSRSWSRYWRSWFGLYSSRLNECIVGVIKQFGDFWCVLVTISISLTPRRKASRRSRSAAVQKPYQAGAQYNSRDSTIAWKTSFNDVSGIPWLRSTHPNSEFLDGLRTTYYVVRSPTNRQ